ncbi:MAG: serine hydrolase [Planctomycetota bacterium]|nr:serine hydrolase [Planctomycetota bacterium]
MSTSRILLSLAACLTLTTIVSAGDEPTLEQRLEKLEVALEAARKDANIPGMSIAIVKDDEIIWTRGFGLADVATQRRADENTIYGVGSTTKAFTATLLGMLVDEGKASWDDPVTKYLPYFDLQIRSDDESAECTLRDLLSHRHGFARMGTLWFGGKVARDEVLRTATGAEPWDDFRAGFHYCNVTYLAAGKAAGIAAGSSWDEMMVERIFEPLKMRSSTIDLSKAQKDARLALGYRWDEFDEQFEHVTMFDLNSIAPAGAVNSNVLDMAQWMRFQLGQGEIDAKRLISTESLLETWAPQIAMGNGASYGLGWMLREHHGRKVVEHGGNTAGFSAQVSLMPEENLGYVLLMNVGASPFREASLELVFDALLDEWPQESVVTEAEEVDFEDYLGTYIANFAKFRDTEFEILINDEHLALDVPNQRTFDLKRPDIIGKWISTLTDRVAVSFQRDRQGAVIGLTMHTNGFNFEVPRQGLEIEPEVPPLELEKYVGTYVRAQGGKRVKLSIVQGRLTMEDKGNRLAFHTPDAEGHAPLRARADQGATFKTDAEGMAESCNFHGGDGDRLFTRLVDSLDTELPTLDEVLALRKTDARTAAMKASRGTKVSGEIWVAQAGLRGTLTIYAQGNDRFAHHLDFGKFGRIDLVAKGNEAWRYNSLRGFNVMKGDELAQAILGHPDAVEGDWNDYFDSVEVVASDTLNDRPVHVVRLKKGDLPSRTYRIDAELGDVLRMNQIVIEGSLRTSITTTYYDFEERDGIRSPMRIEIEIPGSGKMILTIDEVESGLELGDDVFTLEDPDTKD